MRCLLACSTAIDSNMLAPMAYEWKFEHENCWQIQFYIQWKYIHLFSLHSRPKLSSNKHWNVSYRCYVFMNRVTWWTAKQIGKTRSLFFVIDSTQASFELTMNSGNSKINAIFSRCIMNFEANVELTSDAIIIWRSNKILKHALHFPDFIDRVTAWL